MGCDFRDLGAVEALCAAVPELLGCGLDVLVNNACQTVRRPPQYYAETVAREAKLRKAIGNASLPLLEGASEDIEVTEDVALMRTWTAKAPTTSDPALRALLCVAPGDDVRNDAAFPRGLRDANADLGEQLDLRRANSWTSKLEDVSTPELAEVFAINALAPFVINSKLIPVLKDGASDERRRFVINVSAMEGKFYRQKQPTHPHTNMAKAALNMMTKTCAAALAESFVYMTSVDTGWVNDEKPNHLPRPTTRRNTTSRRPSTRSMRPVEYWTRSSAATTRPSTASSSRTMKKRNGSYQSKHKFISSTSISSSPMPTRAVPLIPKVLDIEIRLREGDAQFHF